jgi:hypothetical protein
MNVRRGDIVLAFYPFACGTGTKKRPVLVVQDDRDNQRLTDTILRRSPAHGRFDDDGDRHRGRHSRNLGVHSGETCNEDLTDAVAFCVTAQRSCRAFQAFKYFAALGFDSFHFGSTGLLAIISNPWATMRSTLAMLA